MKNILYSLIAFLTIVLLPVNTLAEIQPTKELAANASKTYGYSVGQNLTLSRIEKKYPSLSGEVMQVGSEFNLSFGSSLKNLDAFLQKNLGSNWVEVKKVLQKRIAEKLTKQTMTKSQAVQFIDSVKKRAKGDIESPVLETLLIFKPGYEEHPEQEFLDGYRYTYRNDGTGKSKGVEFSIKAPKTWTAKEGNRPNVVQKFIAPSGAMLMIIVKDLPLEPNEQVTQSDISDMLANGETKLFLPPDSTYIDGGKMTLEGLPGFWIQYKIKASRVRMSIEMESIMYTVFYKNRMIQIQGTNTISVNGDKIEDGGIKKYERLFDLMANSFVIDGLYK